MFTKAFQESEHLLNALVWNLLDQSLKQLLVEFVGGIALAWRCGSTVVGRHVEEYTVSDDGDVRICDVDVDVDYVFIVSTYYGMEVCSQQPLRSAKAEFSCVHRVTVMFEVTCYDMDEDYLQDESCCREKIEEVVRWFWKKPRIERGTRLYSDQMSKFHGKLPHMKYANTLPTLYVRFTIV